MQRKPTLQNSIVVAFVEKLRDPRASNRWHPIETVIFSLLVGVLCGANDLVTAAHVAQKKQRFIERFVPCPHGTPAHDTIGRVLAMLDPVAFAEAFSFFMSRMTERPVDDVINIDGKTLRGIMNKFVRGKKGEHIDDQVHVVSAFSELRGYVLGQLRSRAVVNEVAAAQDLLRLLAISGSTVTLDAAHNSVKTLAMIVERGGHVVVGVKANNPKLAAAIKTAFKTPRPAVVDETIHAHGRIEHRKYAIIAAVGNYARERFPMIKAFIRTERQRITPTGRIRRPAIAYYATSMEPMDAARIAECVRRRWGIENKLHYVLDVSFDEDQSRVRVGNAAENFSRVRHLALNLLRADKAEKGSVNSKRFSAATDESYLERILSPLGA
jgi:predicted transposase YbfD/YdcC